jgi:hypothetical protein
VTSNQLVAFATSERSVEVSYRIVMQSLLLVISSNSFIQYNDVNVYNSGGFKGAHPAGGGGGGGGGGGRGGGVCVF